MQKSITRGSKQRTPESLSLLEGKAEGAPEASLVSVPAFDIGLTHEISLQLGYHDADDPDEDKEVDLQNVRAGGSGPLVLLPGHSWGPPASTPNPQTLVTYPDCKENGQAYDEPVVHVGVPGPATGEEKGTHEAPSWTHRALGGQDRTSKVLHPVADPCRAL